MNPNDAANLINIINTLQTNSGTKQQLISLINFHPMKQQLHPTTNITIGGNQHSQCQRQQCYPMKWNQINQFTQLNLNNQSTNSPRQLVAIQKNCISIQQCESIKRVVKLQILRNKYGVSNYHQIDQYVSKCKEFNNVNNDYKHLKIFHSTNNDLTKLKQILNEYNTVYDFITNFNNKHILFHKYNNCINTRVSLNELDFFSQKMDEVYNRLNQSTINKSPMKQQIPLKNNNNNTVNTLNIQTIKPLPTYHSINIAQQVIEPPKNTVTSDSKFMCTECGKIYKHACNLKSHMRIHSDDALICSHCNKRFGRKANYKEHLRIHTGETPYQCLYCLRKFKHHHSWKDHTRIHTGENPYKCNVCNKKFKVGHNLTVHLRIHTGEKPYQCKVCFKMFRQKSGLNSHKKRLHSQ